MRNDKITLQEKLQNINNEVKELAISTHSVTEITKRLPDRIEKIRELMLSSTTHNKHLHHVIEVTVIDNIDEAISILKQLKFADIIAAKPLGEVPAQGMALASLELDKGITLFIEYVRNTEASILSNEVS